MASNINLVNFKDYLYPVSQEDYKVMVSLGVTASRFPARSLDILKHTMLKGVKIKIFQWADVYHDILNTFVSAATEAGLRCRTDEVTTVYVIKPSAVANETADQLIGHLTHYLARYSVRVLKEAKERDQGILWRLRMKRDLEIPNGMFYSDVQPPPTVASLDFNAFRVHLSVEDTGGLPTLTVKAQDKIGDDWVSGTSRTFPKSKLDREHAYAMVNFLLSNF